MIKQKVEITIEIRQLKLQYVGYTLVYCIKEIITKFKT